MVEAEQDPHNTNPLQDALTARSYLREVTGLQQKQNPDLNEVGLGCSLVKIYSFSTGVQP